MRLPSICALAVILAACSAPGTPDDARFETIVPQGWAYGDTVMFAADGDSAALDASAIAVRHNLDYPYANLWLEVTVYDVDTAYVDTLDIRLADRYGRPLGRGAAPSFLKVDALPHSRATRLAVRHVMRVDTVRGIEQIAVLPAEYADKYQ